MPLSLFQIIQLGSCIVCVNKCFEVQLYLEGVSVKSEGSKSVSSTCAWWIFPRPVDLTSKMQDKK